MLPFRSEGCDRCGTMECDGRGTRGEPKPELGDSLRRFGLRLLAWFVTIAFGLNFWPVASASTDKKNAKSGKKKQSPASALPAEQSLTNIPLPVGQQAKGLILPDFDLQGRLRGRFEATQAKRIDEEHVGFHGLKITTYTPDNQTDLVIEMNDSILNLKTRILTSNERTTIHRSDFDITGDSVQFDTNTRIGKLVGNVKMVITSQSHLQPQTTE